MIAGLFANAWAKIAAVGAIVAAIALGLLRVFSAGKQAAREEGEKAQLENVAVRSKVDAGVAGSSNDAVRNELRERWTRKP